MDKWLAVVGIGEDGLASPIARSWVDGARVIVGGDRHLAMVPEDGRQRIRWGAPIENTVDEILRRRGEAVCVLASGDPLWYGIGTTLLRRVAIEEMTLIPSPSAFSLACARLGWALTEVETLSLCGRDPALLNAVLYPGAKILVLSEGRNTPLQVAKMLTEKGFGQSRMTVLEHMGGKQERMVTGTAADWTEITADLNTIAIALCHAAAFSRLAGLPDRAYHHDGQLTKREVRAVTLAALAPQPEELLWDVGAGCGSIAIEWLRSDRRCRAIAIEQSPGRGRMLLDNAVALGVPNLRLIEGKAPDALADLPQPDAIFIGGGLTAVGLVDLCWERLRSGGRLVVNTVTVESEQVVLQWQQKLGGELTRIAIQRAEPVGNFLGWKGMAIVTQWMVWKG
jgi:precorrin-6B C5,15-methyltransferase / cobalt-precorrin-6B C5,C15-methyltransferase